ncbi:MAG: photoactive yellow protein [Elstera sp.]
MSLVVLEFDKDDLQNSIAKLSDSEINNLAFGAIELDRTGKVLRYNAMEGQITGRDPKDMIGKNFFTDVAPCTNTPEFKGKFDAGVAKGDLSVMFEYMFDYMMKPTRVKVHMKKSIIGDSYWVFVKRV